MNRDTEFALFARLLARFEKQYDLFLVLFVKDLPYEDVSKRQSCAQI